MHAGFLQMKPHQCGVPLTPQQPVAWLPGVAFDISGQEDLCLDVQAISKAPNVISVHPHFPFTRAALAALCTGESLSSDLLNVFLLQGWRDCALAGCDKECIG